MGGDTKLIVKSCFIIFLLAYSVWLLIMDLLLSTWPLTVLGPLLLLAVWQCCSLKQADGETLTEVFGTAEEKKVIAHRGGGLDAPENTLTAFKLAQSRGCGIVEFDISLTMDGVAVVFHDDLVDRLTTAVGRVDQMTYTQLRELDLGTNFPIKGKYVDEHIPTFNEVIETCLKLDLKMVIDVKIHDTRVVPYIIEAFTKHPGLHHHAAVTTFFPHILYMIRYSHPEIVGCLSWRPYFLGYSDYSGYSGYSHPRFAQWYKQWLAVAGDHTLALLHKYVFPKFLGLSAILLNKDIICPELIRGYAEQDVRVMAWTVNNPREKQYYQNVLNISYLTDTLENNLD